MQLYIQCLTEAEVADIVAAKGLLDAEIAGERHGAWDQVLLHLAIRWPSGSADNLRPTLLDLRNWLVTGCRIYNDVWKNFMSLSVFWKVYLMDLDTPKGPERKKRSEILTTRDELSALDSIDRKELQTAWITAKNKLAKLEQKDKPLYGHRARLKELSPKNRIPPNLPLSELFLWSYAMKQVQKMWWTPNGNLEKIRNALAQAKSPEGLPEVIVEPGNFVRSMVTLRDLINEEEKECDDEEEDLFYKTPPVVKIEAYVDVIKQLNKELERLKAKDTFDCRPFPPEATGQRLAHTGDAVSAIEFDRHEDFDFFVSYNTKEYATVKGIVEDLANRHGLSYWADWKEGLKLPWKDIEDRISRSAFKLIFFGREGFGEFQELEFQLCLSNGKSKDKKIIGVILQQAKLREMRSTAAWLKVFAYVDFSKGDYDTKLARLGKCLTGDGDKGTQQKG